MRILQIMMSISIAAILQLGVACFFTVLSNRSGLLGLGWVVISIAIFIPAITSRFVPTWRFIHAYVLTLIFSMPIALILYFAVAYFVGWTGVLKM